MQLTTSEWVRLYQGGVAYQVFLDGKDVTRTCVFADDVEGVVRFPERDPVDNSIRVNKRTGQPHSFEKRGSVELRTMPREEWDKYFGDCPGW